MNITFKKIWKETLIVVLCFILLGCFMLLQPNKTLEFFSYIIGAMILVLAVLAFYRHYRQRQMITFELLYGIICSAGAVLIFLNQSIIETLIPIVLGAVMIFNAIFKIQYIFDLKRTGVQRWYISLILGVVKIIVGILMIINPWASMMELTVFIGVSVLLFACCDLTDVCFIRYYLSNTWNEDTEDTHINKKDEIEEASYVEIEDIKTTEE